jgi:hypothetical protein
MSLPSGPSVRRRALIIQICSTVMEYHDLKSSGRDKTIFIVEQIEMAFKTELGTVRAELMMANR